MWQPAAGSDPRLDELQAQVRRMREEVKAMLRELEDLEVRHHELLRQLEGR